MSNSDQSRKVLVDLSAAIETLCQKLTEDAEKSAVTAVKNEELKKAMEELNKISPGLGETFNLLASAFEKTGNSAAGSSAGINSFNASLGNSLRAAGPMLLISLSIQAAMQLWDFYKAKVETTAKAQEEALKRMVESTHQARKAVEEFNDAMHPKKLNTVEQNEEQLKKKLEGMDNTANRQSELNHANEEKELQKASTPEEAQKIREKYEVLDKQLEDWRARQKAAIEGAAVAGMESQLKKLKEQEEKLIKKTHAEFQYGLHTGDMSRYKKTTEGLTLNTEEAKSIRDKLDRLKNQYQDDLSQAKFNSDTTREAYKIKGINYNSPSTSDAAPGPGFNQAKQIENAIPGVVEAEKAQYQDGHLLNQSQVQTVAALQQMLIQAHANSDQILKLIVDGAKNNETTARIIEEVKQQLSGTANLGHR